MLVYFLEQVSILIGTSVHFRLEPVSFSIGTCVNFLLEQVSIPIGTCVVFSWIVYHMHVFTPDLAMEVDGLFKPLIY